MLSPTADTAKARPVSASPAASTEPRPSLLRRLACALVGHDWSRVVFEDRRRLHIEARMCPRCLARQRKLGVLWLPCSGDYGWAP
jgi:hypothetical protein